MTICLMIINTQHILAVRTLALPALTGRHRWLDINSFLDRILDENNTFNSIEKFIIALSA